jgi:hypothetical protein
MGEKFLYRRRSLAPWRLMPIPEGIALYFHALALMLRGQDIRASLKR